MKKFGEILLIILAVLGIPAIIQLALPNSFAKHSNLIWIISISLSIVIALTQIDIAYTPVVTKWFRKLRFYLFKTRIIALVLTAQLTIVLLILIFSRNVDVTNILISFGLNILGLNILVLVGKLSNTDVKELVFHEATSGNMYLYSNNKLRYIPDPLTFDLFGFNWSDVIDINVKELNSYELDAPITSLDEMKLVEYRGRFYGIVNDKLKHVPDTTTKHYILNNRSSNYEFVKITSIAGYKMDKPFAKTM